LIFGVVKPIFFDGDRPQPDEAYDLIRVDSGINYLPGYHYHSYPEIFWVTRGECIHLLNGKKDLVSEGDGFFLRKGKDAHQFLPLKDKRFVFMNFVFTPEHFVKLEETHPEIFELCFPSDDEKPFSFHLSEEMLDEIRFRSNQLLNQPNTRFFAEAFLFDFIQKVLVRKPVALHEEGIPDWLARAYTCIQEQEYFSRGAKGFVSVAGRCPEHVSRCARKHFGKTPIQLANDARMRFARKQLLITSRSVEEIADVCGFKDMSQFYYLFRSFYNTSPADYRRKRKHQ